jgi:hypothetical protein
VLTFDIAQGSAKIRFNHTMVPSQHPIAACPLYNRFAHYAYSLKASRLVWTNLPSQTLSFKVLFEREPASHVQQPSFQLFVAVGCEL